MSASGGGGASGGGERGAGGSRAASLARAGGAFLLFAFEEAAASGIDGLPV